VQAIIVFLAMQYRTPTLFSGRYVYPTWAEGIGFGVVTVCLILIPLWSSVFYVKYGGCTVCLVALLAIQNCCINLALAGR